MLFIGVLSGGVTYTRWGHNACPRVYGTQMLYTGRVAGAFFNQKGGGANYLCLPNDPDYNTIRTYTIGIELVPASTAQNMSFQLLDHTITMYHVLFAMLQQGLLN